MRIAALTPPTRRRLWAVIVVTLLLLVVGVGVWVAGLGRLQTMQAEADAAEALAQARNKPIVSVEELDRRYEAGRQSYTNKDYVAAIGDLKEAVDYRNDYKSALVYLFLSYTNLADTQASDPVNLKVAPQTYQDALNLNTKFGENLKKQVGQNVTLLPPNIATYELLVQRTQQQHDTAQPYAVASQVKTDVQDWWNTAIPAWEDTYKRNPNYLKENPRLWIGARLVDSYLSKATYVCQIKGDYAGATSAIDRAIELSRLNALSPEKQAVLQNLSRIIQRGQCQE